MIVVDSSTLVHALVNSESLGVQVNRRLRNESIAAPGLIDLESLNAIKQLERGGITDSATSNSILDELMRLPIDRYDHWPLLRRCWELRHNLSVYDAAYVALAEALDAPLVTSDTAFSRAPGIACQVELISPH